MPLMDTAAQPRAAHCGVGAGVGLGVGGGVGTGIGAGDGALVGDPVIGCTHSVGMGVGGAVVGAGVVALHAATMGASRPAGWSLALWGPVRAMQFNSYQYISIEEYDNNSN